jgi:hypothetical protein
MGSDGLLLRIKTSDIDRQRTTDVIRPGLGEWMNRLHWLARILGLQAGWFFRGRPWLRI